MDEIIKYFNSLLQEIRILQDTSEEGANQEQLFTQIALDLLSEGGETENAMPAYDEKELGTRNQHKINAYAMSDNYETVDMFISIFHGGNDLTRIGKDEIERASKRIINFFKKAYYNEYNKEIDESSPIFEFAHSLAEYTELRENLVRVNAHILTNGSYTGDIPISQTIAGQQIYFYVWDINKLFNLSEKSRLPIELDFLEENIHIPCLKSPIENPDYQAYIAIIPGIGLANLYERFGARLLEQNVRSFLQFTGKINKGIRTTIKDEPHMFLAFNNGIAATADHIELDDTERYIKRINNLQIVNGGQTTASIYHTWKKDKADISNIYVQMKISVIKKEEEFGIIVSQISRYANTQNKVNDADFSANNPTLIELEKLSRRAFSPITPYKGLQTIWFFERARGQYKNLRLKDGFTKSRQKQFDLKYPKNQVFNKTDLAKYANSYNEVTESRKIVIGPHIVVRGNEKNYAQFINHNLPKKVTGIYFEDIIAKFLLFKEAEKRYGIKPNSIGEMRNAVVPYAIALVGHLTDYRINLERIWKEQKVSSELSDLLYDLMRLINQFILDNSPSSHYIEWAKKEDCWTTIKNHYWNIDLNRIKKDLVSSEELLRRKSINDDLSDEKGRPEYEISLLKSIPYSLWKKIAEWGKDSGFLSPNQQSFAGFDMANKIKFNRNIMDNDRIKAMMIYETVCQYNLELLEEADNLAEHDQKDVVEKQEPDNNQNSTKITLELIKKMTEWDKRRHILEDWKWKAMNDVAEGKKPLTDRFKFAFSLNLQKLKKHGFTEDS